MRVVVASSPGPREVREREIELKAGATVADALAGAASPDEMQSVRSGGLAVFVWGRAATPAQALRDGDRVELLRPLRVDPKVARRERFKRQGSRAAGLFSRNAIKPKG